MIPRIGAAHLTNRNYGRMYAYADIGLMMGPFMTRCVGSLSIYSHRFLGWGSQLDSETPPNETPENLSV